MQILGKRSKILLIAVAIAMLATLGLSFALWDTADVKASNGNLSTYANAKVGDIIEFGNYYQTTTKDADGEYIKTPIQWIVVDKDERTGRLTLMSKKILAVGSYFGNYYNNLKGEWGAHYDNDSTTANMPFNQAYADSTVRAFLNNLERLDMGGDMFNSKLGYIPSLINSTIDKGLLSSVGFSNQKYWTGLSYSVNNVDLVNLLSDPTKGLTKRYESSSNEIYYNRPIKNDEYKARPAARGFFDEAFTTQEKSMIEPKAIAGYTGHRWPDDEHNVATKSYVEGTYDKVWIPSATELNVANGYDWNGLPYDKWTNPSDASGSTVFEYFKNYNEYGYNSVGAAISAERTELAKDGFAANYSIPMYNKPNANSETLEVNTDVNKDANSVKHYWTRSPVSQWFSQVRVVTDTGLFRAPHTYDSLIGVRPCVIVKY